MAMKTPSEASSYYNGPVWNWFSLSYSSYLVLQRSLMCGMPLDWQERFVKLMEELEDTYDREAFPGQFWVRARDTKNRFVSDPLSDYKYPPELPYKEKRA